MDHILSTLGPRLPVENPPANQREVSTVPPQIQHVQRCTQHNHISSREHKWLKIRIAHLCVLEIIVIHVSCLTCPCLLLLLSSHWLGRYVKHFWSTMNIWDPMNDHTATISDRVAVSRRQSLLQDMSTKNHRDQRHRLRSNQSWRLEPQELSSTEDPGTDPYQIQERFARSNFPNPITEDMEEFRKVGADVSYFQSHMHSECDSAEIIADSNLEDGKLRRLRASPLYLQNREDCESSRMPIATVTPAALLQERGATAVFSFGNEEPGNQFKSCQMWEDLFLKAKKIICSVKQNLNLRDRNGKLDLSIILSMSCSNMLMLKDWNYKTRNTRIERRQVALKEEKVPVTSGKKMASVRKETNAVSGKSNDRAQKPDHNAATPSEPSFSRGRSVSKKRSIQAKSNNGAIHRQPCRCYLKGFTKQKGVQSRR